MASAIVTPVYAAILAVYYAVLSAWVVVGRAKFRIHHGDGGNARLNRRIRAHGNFAEYVPLILLLVYFLEIGGLGRTIIHALLITLLAARIMHPIGMTAAEASAQQFIFRGASAILTWLVLTIAAVLLLLLRAIN